MDTEAEENLRSLISQKNYFGVEDLVRSQNIPTNLEKAFLELPHLFGSAEVLAKARSLTDNICAIKAVERLEEIYEILKIYGYEKYISFDFGMLSKLQYYTGLLKAKKNVIRHVTGEFQRVYKAKDENLNYEKELNAQLTKLKKMRQKYMDMYTDDLITREELNEKIGGTKQEIERLENELKMVAYHLTKGEQLETILNRTFKEIEDISDVHQMTNAQLKRIIQKIEVDKDGNVDIYLRIFGDLGLDETVLISDNQT